MDVWASLEVINAVIQIVSAKKERRNVKGVQLVKYMIKTLKSIIHVFHGFHFLFAAGA